MGQAHHRLNLPTYSVAALASEIQACELQSIQRGRVSFAGDKWTGWMINGCRQQNKGGFVLGYWMDDEKNGELYFEHAAPIIRSIPATILAARLFKLAPGVNIDLHVDKGEFYFQRLWTSVRKIHIPIITNSMCRNYEGDDRQSVTWYHMGIGEAWMLNGTNKHGAINSGSSDRWHFVIDIDPNDEIEKLKQIPEPSLAPNFEWKTLATI